MTSKSQNCLFENLFNNTVKIGYQVANAKAMNDVKPHSELPSYIIEMLYSLHLALEALPELMLT